MPPAFRRGWEGEGEGKPKIDALARASGRSPPHGASIFRFREREGEALWRSHQDRKAIPANNGTLARREAAGRRARGPVGQPASGNERGKSACGSAQEGRALSNH